MKKKKGGGGGEEVQIACDKSAYVISGRPLIKIGLCTRRIIHVPENLIVT